MNKFKRVALIGRAGHQQAIETIARLVDFLRQQSLEIWVEDEIADVGEFSDLPHCALDHIGQKVELAIVVGGDGSLQLLVWVNLHTVSHLTKCLLRMFFGDAIVSPFIFRKRQFCFTCTIKTLKITHQIRLTL